MGNSKKKKVNNVYIIIACVIILALPIIYYFCYALPQHNKALQEIELQKLEYQKEQIKKEEEKMEEERMRQQEEKDKKIEKDTNDYAKCKNSAESIRDAMLDAKVGCDRNVAGAEGKCVFPINSVSADIIKQISDDFQSAIEKCKRNYPDADLDLIDYRENPYLHPEG